MPFKDDEIYYVSSLDLRNKTLTEIANDANSKRVIKVIVLPEINSHSAWNLFTLVNHLKGLIYKTQSFDNQNAIGVFCSNDVSKEFMNNMSSLILKEKSQ